MGEEIDIIRDRVVVIIIMMSGVLSIITLFAGMYNMTGLGGDCASNTDAN